MTVRTPTPLRPIAKVTATFAVAVTVVLTLALAGCGSAGTSLSSPTSDGDSLPPSPTTDATSLPSTTTPLTVPPLSCDDPPSTTAERLLIERRQHQPTSGCTIAQPPWLEPAASPPCWERCTDGRRFTGFVLDPDTTDTDDGVAVRYAARYVDADGNEHTAAETLHFTGDTSNGWTLSAVTATDLSARRAHDTAVIDTYFNALATGNFTTAANLLTGGASSVATGDRDDLGTLVDDGLLGDTATVDRATVDEISTALAAWCDRGATCREPDTVRTEVTAQHSVRIVATYRSGIASYDVVFTADAVDGTDSVVGLPPKL